MAQLQLAFDKAAENKNRKIILNSQLKDILADTPELVDIEAKTKALTDARSKIMLAIKEHNQPLFDELAEIAASEANDKQLLTDLAINQLTSGEGVEELKDAKGNVLEPVFSVKFVKVK